MNRKSPPLQSSPGGAALPSNRRSALEEHRFSAASQGMPDNISIFSLSLDMQIAHTPIPLDYLTP